jgi:hypothetical protein
MIFRMLITNLAKQMEQATPRNKEHVEENWLETIKIDKVVHIIKEWERMGGDSTVILKSGTIVKGLYD